MTEATGAHFERLYDQLESIDRKLAAHRGNITPEQSDLLRLRRETVLAIADARRAIWGD